MQQNLQSQGLIDEKTLAQAYDGLARLEEYKQQADSTQNPRHLLNDLKDIGILDGLGVDVTVFIRQFGLPAWIIQRDLNKPTSTTKTDVIVSHLIHMLRLMLTLENSALARLIKALKTMGAELPKGIKQAMIERGDIIPFEKILEKRTDTTDMVSIINDWYEEKVIQLEALYREERIVWASLVPEEARTEIVRLIDQGHQIRMNCLERFRDGRLDIERRLATGSLSRDEAHAEHQRINDIEERLVSSTKRATYSNLKEKVYVKTADYTELPRWKEIEALLKDDKLDFQRRAQLLQEQEMLKDAHIPSYRELVRWSEIENELASDKPEPSRIVELQAEQKAIEGDCINQARQALLRKNFHAEILKREIPGPRAKGIKHNGLRVTSKQSHDTTSVKSWRESQSEKFCKNYLELFTSIDEKYRATNGSGTKFSAPVERLLGAAYIAILTGLTNPEENVATLNEVSEALIEYAEMHGESAIPSDLLEFVRQQRMAHSDYRQIVSSTHNGPNIRRITSDRQAFGASPPPSADRLDEMRDAASADRIIASIESARVPVTVSDRTESNLEQEPSKVQDMVHGEPESIDIEHGKVSSSEKPEDYAFSDDDKECIDSKVIEVLKDIMLDFPEDAEEHCQFTIDAFKDIVNSNEVLAFSEIEDAAQNLKALPWYELENGEEIYEQMINELSQIEANQSIDWQLESRGLSP